LFEVENKFSDHQEGTFSVLCTFISVRKQVCFTIQRSCVVYYRLI